VAFSWDDMLASAISWLNAMLALPDVGLSTVFVVSFISATLLPLGSEPAVFAVIKANADLFWPAMAMATAGNTLGGIVDYWMGFGAHEIFARERRSRWFGWLERFGPKTLLLAWLPLIGDPLCVLAGWLKLPFWPSVAYMALGKFLRYLTITCLLLNVPDGFWRKILGLLG
jgi:membrane protein YqaA with SNARE-associated domain